jgi:hypothetical protein
MYSLIKIFLGLSINPKDRPNIDNIIIIIDEAQNYLNKISLNG